MGCRELQPNDFRFVGDDKHELSFPRGNRDYKSIAEGFIFNAENRIISMETADTKLEFVYDYMGRRVEKKVYTGSAGNWTPERHERFVYDGYKQVEKLDALNGNAIAQKFVWNGERILSVNNGADTYYYTQDANKNISELLDSSGTIKAHYEYSPFGKVTVSNGIYADDNPYRFSSEVADDETGLVYYNYRYYSPELGRWLSRDPIGEEGGWNLYGFVVNNPLTLWDLLGWAELESCHIAIFIGHLDEGMNWAALRNADVTHAKEETAEKNRVIDRKNKYRERHGKAPLPHEPDPFAQSGAMVVGCYPDVTNGKLPDNIRDPVTSKGFFDEFLDEKGEMHVSKGKAALKKAIKRAKERALTLCKKPPKCCKEITITVKCGKHRRFGKTPRDIIGKLCDFKTTVKCP